MGDLTHRYDYGTTGNPSHFRTFTPCTVQTHTMLSRYLAQQIYVEDCLHYRHDNSYSQATSTYIMCSLF